MARGVFLLFGYSVLYSGGLAFFCALFLEIWVKLAFLLCFIFIDLYCMMMVCIGFFVRYFLRFCVV